MLLRGHTRERAKQGAEMIHSGYRTLSTVLLLGCSVQSWAQRVQEPLSPDTAVSQVVAPAESLAEQFDPALYKVGPRDEISVRVLNAEDFPTDTMLVGTDGFISLPLIGRVQVAKLTPSEIENILAERLREYILDPQVSVAINEFRSQPVSVIGSVERPGVLQLEGQKSLIEILSLAGGLKEDAGYVLRLTRRLEWGAIPLDTAAIDPSGQYSVAEMDLEGLMNSQHPELNVSIRPNDVISVPRAQMIYVVGAVAKSGGFVLREREQISVLRALALAGGLGVSPAPGRARIVRAASDGGQLREIPIDLKAILEGKSEEVALVSEDILFVPTSNSKIIAGKAISTAVSLVTGLIIWR